VACLGRKINHLSSLTIRAKARAGAARLGVQAANFGAAFIDGAAARYCIEVDAIAAGAPREREEALLVIEMINQLIFDQTLGDAVGWLMLGFKRIDPAEPHQLFDPHLQRHGAAVGAAGVAQASAIARPCFRAIHIDRTNRYRA
jgi:hypothetical protein